MIVMTPRVRRTVCPGGLGGCIAGRRAFQLRCILEKAGTMAAKGLLLRKGKDSRSSVVSD